MGKKDDLIDFEYVMVVGVRRAYQRVSDSTDLLGLHHRTISRVYRGLVWKRETLQ